MQLARLIVTYSAGVALLAGCADSTAMQPSASSPQNAPRAPSGSKTFNFTGKKQVFHLPSGVTQVVITATGASGSSYPTSYYACGTPGNGGLVKAKISVTSGEKLIVYVGGVNGFNGGAPSPYYGSGGGASDVRQAGQKLKNRVVVAGGGGEGGCYTYPSRGGKGGSGGAGGAKVGAAGGAGYNSYCGIDGNGGGGGTQKAGGAGGSGGNGSKCFGSSTCNGSAGADGAFGVGGAPATSCRGPGGGAGGGWYGGGGGGAGFHECYRVSCNAGAGGGGGGGSSFIETHAVHLENVRGGAPLGDGQIVISW